MTLVSNWFYFIMKVIINVKDLIQFLEWIDSEFFFVESENGVTADPWEDCFFCCKFE